MVMVNVNGHEYSMAKRIKAQIDFKIRPRLMKKDKDYVLMIDGAEGSGKSTLAFQLGYYLDPTLNLDRICFTSEQFRDAIMKAEKGQVVVFDEAFIGLSSRSSLSEINKMLVSLMMQMRQKNLCVIIVLPTVFMLERYVVLHRSNVLFHVYEKRGTRGFYMIFNKKKIKILYLLGRKLYNYNVVKSGFTCRFGGKFPLGEEMEAEYRKKKLQALETKEEKEKDKKTIQRDKLLFVLKDKMDFTNEELSDMLETYGIHLPKSTISDHLNAIKGDVPKYRTKRDPKISI